MRVLVSGVGGELGTRVATLLDADPRVSALAGIDCEPPRRRISRMQFTMVDPTDRLATVGVVRDFEPTAVVHLGVFEPNARCAPGLADHRTRSGARYVLGAAAECPTLDRIVARSGIEVYGRCGARPDEKRPVAPTTPYGKVLVEVEQIAQAAGAARDCPVTRLRFAPIVGPHFPSPLGRYLRLTAVPIAPLAELPFSLIHQEDAAAAIVRSLHVAPDAALNVAGRGAVTAYQAARRGGRVPVPVIGPGWLFARAASSIAGAPIPPHVIELLRFGRVADTRRVDELLDWRPTHSTAEVLSGLFQWASVVYLSDVGKAA